MKYLRLATLSLSFLSILSLGVTGCGDGDDEGGTGESQPILDEWETVLDTKFIATDEDGKESPVEKLSIGGRETEGNFANRGNIEVYFTEADAIKVEMRRFTIAKNDEEAQDAFNKMHFWAYNGGTLNRPEALDEATKCDADSWLDGCSIRVWYEGKKQRVRDGADFRVYLPKTWKGELELESEDNLSDNAYPNLSDFTVKGVLGIVRVKGAGGNVSIEVSPDAEPVFDCNPDQIAMCKASNWDTNDAVACPCMKFGQVDVLMSRASNVKINLNNSDLLTQVISENTQEGINASWDPECKSTVVCGDFDECVLGEGDETWKSKAEINASTVKFPGTGFGVKVEVNGCETIEYAVGPEDFNKPQTEPRGSISICGKAGDLCPEISAG